MPKKTKEAPKAEAKTERYYRIKKISRYQYQLIAVDLVDAKEIAVGKADLRQIVEGKLADIVCED